MAGSAKPSFREFESRPWLPLKIPTLVGLFDGQGDLRTRVSSCRQASVFFSGAFHGVYRASMANTRRVNLARGSSNAKMRYCAYGSHQRSIDCFFKML
jgi:hypothetical protein